MANSEKAKYLERVKKDLISLATHAPKPDAQASIDYLYHSKDIINLYDQLLDDNGDAEALSVAINTAVKNAVED